MAQRNSFASISISLLRYCPIQRVPVALPTPGRKPIQPIADLIIRAAAKPEPLTALIEPPADLDLRAMPEAVLAYHSLPSCSLRPLHALRSYHRACRPTRPSSVLPFVQCPSNGNARTTRIHLLPSQREFAPTSPGCRRSLWKAPD